VIRAHLAAELLVEGERMPGFVWTIDHPAGLVLVDTGLIDVRPEVDDMSPTPHPENIPRDVACVIDTHLHFDHCGGNRLFPGVPIHVQARELADARSLEDYSIREWVDFDGAPVSLGRSRPPRSNDGHRGDGGTRRWYRRPRRRRPPRRSRTPARN
jgi:glyoxylase-like metal-dependent hydrolase (beta-lactamase superfamily II)